MMKSKDALPAYKATEDESAPQEAGYAAWKRAKIETGLNQAKDRTAMIPAENVWRELGLER